jgi:predicted O-linked N-acetylglucosamine transferase (SPINDLY family)
MTTTAELFALARHSQQAGDLRQAESYCRQVLQIDSGNAEALHLLGGVAYQVGRLDAAGELVRQALARKPGVAAWHADLGLISQALGRMTDAAACYEQALRLKPDSAEAHAALGNVLAQLGRPEDAMRHCAEAVRLRPDLPDAHNNLGNTLLRLGKTDQATSAYERAMQLKPDLAPAHNNLGVVRAGQGRFEPAVACFRRAVELQPDYLDAHINLGLALHRLGRLDEAVASYRRTLQLNGNLAQVHNNLGSALHAQGHIAAAGDAYQRALQLNPNLAEAQNNLGNIFKLQGRPDDAVACYRRALDLQPNYAEALNNLGTVMLARGPGADAIACFRRALLLKPDFAYAHSNLGNALHAQGQLTEAKMCHRRALQLTPDLAEAHTNLANALKDLGRLDEAVAEYRRALQLKPDLIAAHSDLLQALHYQAGVTLSELEDAHAEYERQHAAPLRPTSRPHAINYDPDRRLRLGFVSADLRRHPVGYFTIPFVENLARDQAELVCYYDCPVADEVTARFRAASATWHLVFGWTDERLAEQVRADGIDILFDLAGHTAHNRLLVFARKPAPLQMTWCGYSGTTGLTAIDFILADRRVIPVGAERQYTERVLRLPDGYVCYDPPTAAPAVAALPAVERGHVTFGSFNNPTKVGPQVIAAWAQTLRRVPKARLVLKYKWLEDDGLTARLGGEFARHGIDADRVSLLGGSPYTEFWRAYHDIDVALDTFPFSGGITTCDAMWMGVPVITCPGETFAARHSLSHLSNVGLTETIAESSEAYVERAVTLANDLPRLAQLRAGLRQRMATSPLCDGQRFAANLLGLLRDMWREQIASARR